MADQDEVIVDFVARGDRPDEWQLVLVEEGPWEGEVNFHLTRLQTRLYGCVDAALDGQLAEQFPESRDKWVMIRLDCYGGPQADIQQFFDRFSEGLSSIDDYRQGLLSKTFIRGIRFQLNLDAHFSKD